MSASSTIDLVHPTAIIDPSARIDPTARIGANARIDADVIVGPECVVGDGTVLLPRVILVRRTTLGERNTVHPYAVLGGDPQDRSYDPARPGELFIGDRNVFREAVTINRGNWNGPATRVGSGCYLMSQAHLGHNVQIGDNVTMANSASLAGHSRLGSNSVLSGFAGVHQFTDVGEGVMFRAHAAVSMHVPPFVIVAAGNHVGPLNKVGLQRNPAFTDQDRREVKEVYRAVYRRKPTTTLEQVVADLTARTWGPAATTFVTFVKNAITADPPRKRGLCGGSRGLSRPRALSRSVSSDD